MKKIEAKDTSLYTKKSYHLQTKVIRFSELRLYLIPKLAKTRTELFKLSNAFFNFTHQFLEIKNPLWILRSQIFFFHTLSQIIQLWD